MAKVNLTLASLATSAIPGLQVTGSESYQTAHQDQFSALIRTVEDQYILAKLPKTSSAAAKISREQLSLASITAGVQSRLPFKTPTVLGQAPYPPTKATFFDFLGDNYLSPANLTAEVASSIGAAIAAIHDLPSSVITDAGLPYGNAAEIHQNMSQILESAIKSGRLPDVLGDRWRDVLTDQTMWQFDSTVIHGSIQAESMLVTETELYAITDWSEFSIADPAMDLAWLYTGIPETLIEIVLDRYRNSRQLSSDQGLRRRAAFYAELELAKWLLFGVESSDEAIIADAEQMLAELVDSIAFAEMPEPESEPLTLAKVESVLAANSIGVTESDYVADSELAREIENDPAYQKLIAQATAPIDIDFSADIPLNSTGELFEESYDPEIDPNSAQG